MNKCNHSSQRQLFRELNTAKLQLAALTNLSPGLEKDFDLLVPERDANTIELPSDMTILEDRALLGESLARPRLDSLCRRLSHPRVAGAVEAAVVVEPEVLEAQVPDQVWALGPAVASPHL